MRGGGFVWWVGDRRSPRRPWMSAGRLSPGAAPGDAGVPEGNLFFEGPVSSEDGIGVGDDDGVRDELRLEAGGDHFFEGEFFLAAAEVEGPGEVASGGGAAEAGIAVDEDFVLAVRLANGLHPAEEGFDLLVCGGEVMACEIDVVKIGDVVIFRRDPVGSESADVGSGVLEGDEVVWGKAFGGVGPFAGADENFHDGFIF